MTLRDEDDSCYKHGKKSYIWYDDFSKLKRFIVNWNLRLIGENLRVEVNLESQKVGVEFGARAWITRTDLCHFREL